MRPWSNANFLRAAFLVWLCQLWPVATLAQEGGQIMVMALTGKVTLASRLDKRPLVAFERVAAGDVLLLDNATLGLLYPHTGRQEHYRGSGRVDLGPEAGSPAGLPAAEIKMLPVFVARQIARTPLALASGAAKTPRLRAIAPAAGIAKVEQTYQRMRMEAAAGDLAPEMYRLSALYEMKAYDAVQTALSDLEVSYFNNSEAKLLIVLYRKALTNARRPG